jgi:tetratricopeptide (TPR) repeat protein
MRRTATFVCLVAAVALSAGNAAGSPASESMARIFDEGNASYQKGDFAAAEGNYRRILEAGADSGIVYYNLGNACFKQRKLGEAIYYWEKARRKLPADPDIRENLELAHLMLVDRIDVPSDPFPVRVLSSAVSLITVTQSSWLTLILFLAANALFSVYLLARSQRLALRGLVASLVTFLLTLVVGISLAWKIYDTHHRLRGIVIEQKVDVRSGPGPENVTVFTVHEGVLVQVRGTANDWYHISLPNGWTGWLQSGAVRIL